MSSSLVQRIVKTKRDLEEAQEKVRSIGALLDALEEEQRRRQKMTEEEAVRIVGELFHRCSRLPLIADRYGDIHYEVAARATFDWKPSPGGRSHLFQSNDYDTLSPTSLEQQALERLKIHWKIESRRSLGPGN